MRPTRWLLLAWLTALAGCSSAPPVNYTLSPPLPPGAVTPSASRVGPYALAEVTVPPEVDHAELAVQQTDGRILLLANDLWAAPLGGHLRTALALEPLWRVRFAGTKNFLTCFVRLQEPVGVGVTPLVLGQQKNIQQLSVLIAETLTRQGKPSGANCATSS